MGSGKAPTGSMGLEAQTKRRISLSGELCSTAPTCPMSEGRHAMMAESGPPSAS